MGEIFRVNPGNLSGLVEPTAHFRRLNIGPTDTSTTVENIVSVVGDYNDYFGLWVANTNKGTTASTDIVVGNANSDYLNDPLLYVDFGLNGANNSNPFNTFFAAGDAYLFTGGSTNMGGIDIASGNSNSIKFAVGGLLATNEVARFTSAGMDIGLAGTLTGAISFEGAVSGATILTANSTGASGVVILPQAGTTLAGLGIAETFTATQTGYLWVDSNNTVTVSSNAGTCSSAYRLNTFTNSSAATMAITLAVSTPTPANGQMMIVRIYDFSGVAETIGWTNTENSQVAAPLTSNGSTTLPLTVGFQYNGGTSKWRCIAVS